MGIIQTIIISLGVNTVLNSESKLPAIIKIIGVVFSFLLLSNIVVWGLTYAPIVVYFGLPVVTAGMVLWMLI